MKRTIHVVAHLIWCFYLLAIGQSYAQNQAPASLSADFSFTIEAEIAQPLEMGDTIDGKRLSIPITGGKFYGDDIKGDILPGGADYQVIRNDGVVMLHAVYMIKTQDGVLINVVNDGLIVPAQDDKPGYFRTSPRFIAPQGKYDWLNKAIFVCSVRGNPAKQNSIFMDVYRLK